MGYRRFVDRQGKAWEVRPRSRREWDFLPAGENSERERSVRSPTYERDPFELSAEELQRLLDLAPAPQSARKPSPFRD